MNQCYDVAIIGGGIVGASIAHALGGRRSVVILEMEEHCGYHATGRSAAEFTLRFHTPTAGALTSASHGFFVAPPEGFTEVPLLRRRGNLVIAERSRMHRLQAVLADENEADKTPGLKLLGPDELLDHVPFLDPGWLGGGFFDPECWDVEVGNLLEGYLRGAKRSGADVKLKARVMSAARRRNEWALETEQGTVRAATVVNAAGAWVDTVGKLLGAEPLGLAPLRRTAIVVRVPDWDVSEMPEVNEVDEQFYFKPDAGQLMVSPADETPSEACDAWPEEIDIAYAAHHLTECTTLEVNHVAHSWAGLRTFAADRKPVIGMDKNVEGLLWAAGLGGFGIQTSPAIGSLCAALLVGDEATAHAIFPPYKKLAPGRLR